MAVYKIRDVTELKAFHMTREGRADMDSWPKWLKTAWLAERNQYGSVQPRNHPHPDDPHPDLHSALVVVDDAGAHNVPWGSYLVYPEADFDVGAGWGRLISMKIGFGNEENPNHNEVAFYGPKSDVEALLSESRND